MKRIILTALTAITFGGLGFGQESIQLGQEVNDRIFADNSSTKYYGGGLFFRIHDERALPHKYHTGMVISEDNKIGIGVNNPISKLTIFGTDQMGWNSGIELNREDGGKGWIVVDEQGMKFRTPINHDNFYFRDNDNNTLFSIRDGGYVEVNSIADVGKGQSPALLIGQRNGHHIGIDGNEIGAFLNNENATLYLNGSNSTSNTIINGEGQGKVGIGTTSPDEKLTVKGKIHAEEVRVDLSVPADYVFEKYYTGESQLKGDYVMPTLEEVEAFTKANNHLPSIPSAQEIQAEGLHLKEMTNLLLQKIEELTLYTIEQQKQLQSQQQEIQELKKKVNFF